MLVLNLIVTRQSDLFIVTPEPELTEFEKAVKNMMRPYVKMPDEIHKENAANLLKLAREQFIKDGYVIEKKTFHDAVEKIADKHKAEMSVEYSLHCKVENGTRHAVMNWNEFQKVAQHFINCGKAEALKDLPRWTKCADCTPKPKYSNEWIFSIDSENVTRESAIVHKGYFLPLDGLEKLPGFKEDEK